MKISVGIPTYNRGAEVIDTLHDVLNQDRLPDEIIVVDQSDWYPFGVKEKLAELCRSESIHYIRQEEPNLPMARNRVLKESASDIVVFIDDDVQLPKQFICAHIANYEDELVSAVAGGLSERGTPVRPQAERSWRAALDYQLFDFGWTVRVEDFGTFKGCNHSLRRKSALELGGYDERFRGSALREETDLAFRICRAGGRIVFDPLARLHHLRAPSGGCRLGTWGNRGVGGNILRFAHKHKSHLGLQFWREVWLAYRLEVLNKDNLRRPLEVIPQSYLFAAEGARIEREIRGSKVRS